MALPGIASFSDYGGEKQDYAAPEDPTTDRSAAEMNPAFADTAAMTRMIPRMRMTFTVSGSTCTVTAHDAVWGTGDAVKPNMARLGAGRYLVSMPITVTDALGQTHTPNITCGWANANDSADYYAASVFVANGLNFNVWTWNLSAGALGDPDQVVHVWVA